MRIKKKTIRERKRNNLNLTPQRKKKIRLPFHLETMLKANKPKRNKWN